jgi:hypothetical protein
MLDAVHGGLSNKKAQPQLNAGLGKAQRVAAQGEINLLPVTASGCRLALRRIVLAWYSRA